MSEYTKILQSHLTTYKSLRLEVKETGVFMYKGREVCCR